MKKTIILLFMVSFLQNHLLALGMGDGCCGDPGETHICFGDGTINGPSINGYEEQIPRIKRFYEYKSYIIGLSTGQKRE